MGGLGIEDITIGYSSRGAAAYVQDLNTQAIVETNTIITNTTQEVITALNAGWQGRACDQYVKKYTNSAEALKEKLKELEQVFNATLAAQEESYQEQDANFEAEIGSDSLI